MDRLQTGLIVIGLAFILPMTSAVANSGVDSDVAVDTCAAVASAIVAANMAGQTYVEARAQSQQIYRRYYEVGTVKTLHPESVDGVIDRLLDQYARRLGRLGTLGERRSELGPAVQEIGLMMAFVSASCTADILQR